MKGCGRRARCQDRCGTGRGTSDRDRRYDTGRVSGGRVCGLVEGVGQPLRRGEQDLVVTVDLGNAGAVQAAAYPWVPERGARRHRLVVGEGQEASGQLTVYRAAQVD